MSEKDFGRFDQAASATPEEKPAATTGNGSVVTSSITNPATAARIKSLTRQRDQAMNKVLRIYESINIPLPIAPEHLKVHSLKLQSAYNEYSRYHSEIVAIIPDDELEAQENEYIRFENYFHHTSAAVEARLLQHSVIQMAPPAQVVIHQQPLKAPIPTFDGEYTKWPKFKAMFQDVMAQSRDSDAIKLYHLDKALVGAAAGVLDAKTINEGNYAQAWTILSERYENQRVIVETHIRGLLSLKRMETESHTELRSLLDECINHVESLEYLKQEVTGVSELMIVYLLTAALDKSTRKQWEQTLIPGKLPQYRPTIAFLKSQCQVLERCEAAYPQTAAKLVPKQQGAKVSGQQSHAATTMAESFGEKCDFCGAPHRNYQCNKLNALTTAEKFEKVRLAGICFNCLRKGHRSIACPSSKTCQKCQRRHHTQLHDDDSNSQPDAKTSTVATEPEMEESGHGGSSPSDPLASQPPETNVTTTCHLDNAHATKTVLLLTAVVLVTDRNNQTHPCRALLDSGSQANFITETMANTLGIEKKRANVPISGINNVRSLARDKVQVQFQSRCSDFHASLECLVTPKVTGMIPTTDIDVTNWALPDGIQLADPSYCKTNKVDLLIGGELFFALMKPGHITLDEGLPELRNSHLGWLVTGAYYPAKHEAIQYSHVASLESVEEMIRQFWEVEEVPSAAALSTEEQKCEDHFASTYTRDHTGRFVVRLPLNENADQIDSCRNLALRRFYILENRLQRNPELKTQYVNFIREYEQLGHCRAVDEASDAPDLKPYYLPHHAVLRPGSSSTKCRVVFDASAKSAVENHSLNEALLVGPVVQNDIFSIMLKFRQHRYVFTADITKMYRQINVHPDDTHKQRIFWREHPNEPLKILELSTVTYGTASAPFQATRCLLQLANDEAENFPMAAEIVKTDCYVDDVLSGAATIDEAIEAQRQLKEMLARGGFPIHKWCSNAPELLVHIPEEERESPTSLTDRHVNEVIKVLGLLWEPNTDELLIAESTKLVNARDQPATKRIIYSEVAKHFDPLGLFSPSILLAKLLVQRLWDCKLGWDDPVDDDIQKDWNKLKSDLSKLLQIKVPRQVTFDGAIAYELHGFADASNAAYGACVYVQSIMEDGSAKSRLLVSKSKMAPLHALTIPRKELCAALLLVRLVRKVIPALTIPIGKVVLYSDSEIVLSWLKKHPHQLLPFVCNRINEIQVNSKEYEWKYVRSQNNPADVVSRGLEPGKLMINELFWTGGAYINSPVVSIEAANEVPDDELPELKSNVVALPSLIEEPLEIFESCSSFRKLQRTIAWILRFLKNARSPKEERIISKHLTVPELRRSTIVVVRVIQHIELGDEILRVKSETPCKQIGNLNPIYTDEDVLRVGGRLKHSKLPDESKHQLILPNTSPVTHRLIRELHYELLHVGPAGLLSAIRQRFWLLRARSTIRQVTRSCVKCFRANPTGITQLMGDLPKQRVTPSPAFNITGVDYAGPILVKQGTYRCKVVKAYIAVFVCMATKAIHLELVSDLTSDAFIAALQRFVSRRGLVSEMHSDNATNFHGTNNELHRLYEMFRNQPDIDKVLKFCQVKEIEWHFIPPDSPEFGGLWEAAVKCTKTHLKRVVGNNMLNFEEMTTILCEIEAVLNSRPLFAISGDPADPEVITPAHYLINRPMTAVPEPSYEDLKIGRLSRWQLVQLLREQFWRAWSRDYLSSLQPRKKNWNTSSNVRPGMIVLLQDKNRPPLQWKLGRITAVHPGHDDLVRVVDVFSEGKTFSRSISKLSVLPIEENQGQRDQ